MVLPDGSRGLQGLAGLCFVECSDIMQDTNPAPPMVSYAVSKMR
jgi:hypothetical protein